MKLTKLQKDVLSVLVDEFQSGSFIDLFSHFPQVSPSELKKSVIALYRQDYVKYVKTMDKKRLPVSISQHGYNMWKGLQKEQRLNKKVHVASRKLVLRDWMKTGASFAFGVLIIILIGFYFLQKPPSSTDLQADLTEIQLQDEKAVLALEQYVKDEYDEETIDAYTILGTINKPAEKHFTVSCRKMAKCKMESAIYVQVILHLSGEWEVDNVDVLH